MTRQSVISELQNRIAAMESGGRVAEPPRSELQAEAQTSAVQSNDALKKIIALVNASDKSERAIRDRLVREGFSEPAIEGAVGQAKQYGFIDDRRFAEVLVRSRISQGRGSAGIIRELAENDIDAEDVPGWPYDFPLSTEEETERAIGLLQRKPPHAKNKREAAYRRLMQKGYPSMVASSAARLWFEAQNEQWR